MLHVTMYLGVVHSEVPVTCFYLLQTVQPLAKSTFVQHSVHKITQPLDCEHWDNVHREKHVMSDGCTITHINTNQQFIHNIMKSMLMLYTFHFSHFTIKT